MDQAAIDVFLGWQRSQGLDGKEHDFYVRQLWDWKASIDLVDDDLLGAPRLRAGLRMVARPRPRALRRPARDRRLPGEGATFDDAIARFSSAYADQNELDHQRLADAVEAGEVTAITGV